MDPKTISLVMIFFLVIDIFGCQTTDEIKIESEPISEIENLGAPDIVIAIPQEINLKTAILFGNINNKIINPKSVSLEKLIKANEKFELANYANQNSKTAKQEIYIMMAQASVMSSLEKYYKEYFIDTVIFKEKEFFNFLKTIVPYTSSTDEELRVLFDITDNIIAEIQKEKLENDNTKSIFIKPSLLNDDL